MKVFFKFIAGADKKIFEPSEQTPEKPFINSDLVK